MARHKDGNWNLPEGQVQNWEQVYVAVLMGVRDELKRVNSLLLVIAAPLRCQTFLKIPAKLDAIRKNTTRKPRKKKETDAH